MDSFDSYVIRKLYQETARHGDKLAKIEKRVNWKAFTPIIQPIYNNQGTNGGRPNMDPVLMVKLLVLQAWYGLSDPELERQTGNRIDFMHFLGFPEKAPDYSTVWRFRERARAFKEIEKTLTDLIGQTEETIEKRIEGLKAEDEFLLLCMALGSMDTIIPLPQKKYLEKDYTIPDFLISIKKEQTDNENKDEYNMMLIETKKMKKNQQEYAISINYLNKLKEYAKILNAPLFWR